MELKITARHMELTAELREYAEKRILPLSRYHDNIIKALLVLSTEKHRQMAELAFSIARKKLVTKSETSSMTASIDEVSHKMERILRSHHDRVKDHKSHDFEEQKKEFLNEMAQEI